MVGASLLRINVLKRKKVKLVQLQLTEQTELHQRRASNTETLNLELSNLV